MSFTDIDVTAEETKQGEGLGGGDGDDGGAWDALGGMKDEDLFVWLQLNGLGEVDMLDIFLVSSGVSSVSDLLKMSDEDILDKPEGEKLLTAVNKEKKKREQSDAKKEIHVDAKDIVKDMRDMARGEFEEEHKKLDPEKVKHAAAARIQALFRGRQARRKIAAMQSAATKIQARWRGRFARKLCEAVREASRVQAGITLAAGGFELPADFESDDDSDDGGKGEANYNVTKGEWEVYTYEDPTGR